MRIAQLLEDIINEINLSVQKVTSTVTDNGSNFVKAFKEYGIHIGPMQRSREEDDDVDDGMSSGTEEEASFEEEFQLQAIEQSEDEDLLLSRHIRCASHTLSLVATTDARSALQHKSFASLNHCTMGRCSALWTKSGRPKSAEIIHNVLGCSLKIPCVTRWNSLYDAIIKLLKHKNILGKLMTELDLPVLKSSELEFLQEYVMILEPVATAIDRLQGDRSVFYGDLLPTLLRVHCQLVDL